MTSSSHPSTLTKFLKFSLPRHDHQLLLPPNHLKKFLKFALLRYEDTYSIDQSLRGEAVEAWGSTNLLRRKMRPSLERAEKVETFSYASSFCDSLDLILKWNKTRQQELLKTCQSVHGWSHRRRIIDGKVSLNCEWSLQNWFNAQFCSFFD